MKKAQPPRGQALKAPAHAFCLKKIPTMRKKHLTLYQL